MALNLRSPIFTGNPIEVDGYNIYKVYIYDFMKPSEPEYTIKKYYNPNVDVGQIEISKLIMDYLDITFVGNYNSQCVQISVDLESYNSSGTLVLTAPLISSEFAFDSYSYFEEESFNLDDSPIMISNRIVYALADNLVRIPVYSKDDPTVTFLKDGEVINSTKYFGTSFINGQIQYATILGGNVDYDNYGQRVVEDGGIFENYICLDNFFDKIEVGEADEVIVYSDNTPPEVIKIKNISECKYEPKKVTFVNKFGALQDVYFFKKSVKTMTVKKESYKSNILDSNFSYSRTAHVNRNFNILGNESIKLSSGYLSEDYNEVFKQMLLSKSIWITNLTDLGEKIIPVNIKTTNVTYKTSVNDRLVEYTFDFEHSFDVINNIT